MSQARYILRAMPGPATLGLFALATLILVATPGPGVLYVVGRAVGGGRRAGFASMLGIETGEAVYIIGASVGLTALIARSAVALATLRFAGAAYLIVLGIRSWMRAAESEREEPASGRWRSFGQGLAVQLLNPKVALFFLAFFPQFLHPGHPVAPQVLLLGGVYLAIAVASDTVYVLLASSFATRFTGSARARRRRARFSAATYLALGIAAAAMGDRSGSAGTLAPGA